MFEVIPMLGNKLRPKSIQDLWAKLKKTFCFAVCMHAVHYSKLTWSSLKSERSFWEGATLGFILCWRRATPGVQVPTSGTVRHSNGGGNG